MAILRGTEKAMVRAKLMEKNNVLRRDDGHLLRRALEFEVKGKRKRGRPKKQECRFGEGGCYESSKKESGSWRDCCQCGVNLATPFTAINPDQNLID